jgi:hypothetical protein
MAAPSAYSDEAPLVGQDDSITLFTVGETSSDSDLTVFEGVAIVGDGAPAAAAHNVLDD